MNYTVKEIYTATDAHPRMTAGETMTFYIVKGGYVRSEKPIASECWSRRHFAEKHARETDIRFNKNSMSDYYTLTSEVIAL